MPALAAGSGKRTAYDAACGALRPSFTHGRLSGARRSEGPGVVWAPSGSGARALPDGRAWRLAAEDDVVSAVAVAPDGARVVVCGRSGFADVVRDGVLVRRWRPFENGVAAFAVFDESGGLVVLGTLDGDVRVFDVDNAVCTHVFRVSGGSPVTAVAFHPIPENMLLFVGTEDGTVCQFDLATRQRAPVRTVNHHVSAVTCFAFVADGRLCVTSGRDKVICVAKAHDMSIVRLIGTGESLVSVTAPHGTTSDNVIVSVGERGVLRVWDVSSAKEDTEKALSVPFVHINSNAVAAASNAGKRGGGGDDDGHDSDDDDQLEDIEIQISDMKQCAVGKVAIALSDHTILFVSVSPTFVPTVDRLVCGNLEEVYDLRSLPRSQTSEGSAQQSAPEVLVASNSTSLWVMRPSETSVPKRTRSTPVSDTDAMDTEFDVQEDEQDADLRQNSPWTCEAGLQGHRAIILALDVLTSRKALGKGSSVSAYAASSSRDKTARVWRRSSASGLWSCFGVAEGHTDAVGAVAMSPRTSHGQFYIVTAAADRTMKLWSLDQAARVADANELEDDEEDFDNDRRRLVHSADVPADGRSAVMKLSAKWTVLAHDKDVNAIAVSPDAQVIATGSQDKTVKLWDAGKGTLRFTCKGHRRGIWAISFSHVDRVVASGSGDATIRLWSVQTGTCLRTLQGHLSGVLKTVFISNGTQIASSGADGLVKVWSTRDGVCDVTIDAHEDRIWALDTVEDGDVLISGGADGRVAIWRDTTAARAATAVKEREEEALMGQMVNDAARARKWATAARGALRLNMPRKLKSVVEHLVTTSDDADAELITMIRGLRDGVEDKGNDRKEKLLSRLCMFCRDWNATGGSRSASVATRVLQAIFSLWTPEALCDELSADKRALVEALSAHTTRHLERVAGLSAKTSLLEHTLESMRALGVLPDTGKLARRPVTVRSEPDTDSSATVGTKRKKRERDESRDQY